MKAKLSGSTAISMFPLLRCLRLLQALKHLVMQLLGKEGSVVIPALHVGNSFGEQGWESSCIRMPA